MTAAGFGIPRSTARTGRAPRLAWHAAIHALMLAAMIVAMRPASTAMDHLLCVAGIAAATIGAAPSARTRPHVRIGIVDAWATALLILSDVMCSASSGGGGPHEHGAGIPLLPALVAIGVGWSIMRLVVTERRRLAGALVTAAELAVMATAMLVSAR